MKPDTINTSTEKKINPEIEILSIPLEDKQLLQNWLERDIAFALAAGRITQVQNISIAEKGSRDEMYLFLEEKHGGESNFHLCAGKEWHVRIHEATPRPQTSIKK